LSYIKTLTAIYCRKKLTGNLPAGIGKIISGRPRGIQFEFKGFSTFFQHDYFYEKVINNFGEFKIIGQVRWHAACGRSGMWFFAVSSNSKWSVCGSVLSSALMLFLQLSVRANGSVTLAWNPSATADVAGYKIYYGTSCRSYCSVVAVGNTTNAVISGLAPGTTYYFAATTLDSAGNESGFSNEASYAMPVTPAALATATRPGGGFGFTVTGDAGQPYVVQASTNLLDWISLQTNTAPFLFTDTNAAGFNQRFYRVYFMASPKP
jgi:hypothetical protein